MRDLLFHSIFLPLIVLGFYSTHLSVLIWVWISLLPPTDMLYGTFGVLPFNKIVAAVTVFTLFLKQEKKDFYFDKLMFLIVLYGVIVTLSYMLSEQNSSFADVQYDKFWKELVLFFIITGVMYSQHRISQMMIVFSLGFGFLMVKEALIFLLTAGGHKVGGMGVVGDNNGVALALLMTIPLTLYCAAYMRHKYARIIFYSVAVLGAITVIATYSRGGFVGLLALGFMLLKGSKHKVKTILVVAILSIALYSLMPNDYLTRVDTIQDATSDSSFATRLLAWKINVLLAIQHPILGVGLYGCVDYGNWISQMPIARNWLFESPLVLRSFVAHSIYFQALGDTGFTGLTLFLSILLTALYQTHKAEKKTRGRPDLHWLGDLARALKMSIIVYMISGAALSLIYFEPLYIILALSSRAYRLVQQEIVTSVADRNRPLSSLARVGLGSTSVRPSSISIGRSL